MKNFYRFKVYIKEEKDDTVIETHYCRHRAEANRKVAELIQDLKDTGDAEDYYVSLEIIPPK